MSYLEDQSQFYLDGLVRSWEDLKVAEQAQFAIRPSEARSYGSRAPRESLAREFAALAIPTVVAASLLNACGTGQLREGSVTTLLPILTCGEDPSRSSSSHSGPELAEFRLRAGMARNLTMAWLESIESEAPIIDLPIVIEAWRNACACGAAVGDEALQTDRTLESADQVWWRSNVAVLRESALGNCPCLDAQSKIVIPGWVERRGAQRHRCEVSVKLEIVGNLVPAVIKDISVTGARLQVFVEHFAGDKVTVVLPHRRLGAGVKWIQNGRIGIVWDLALRSTDPLFGTSEL